MPYPAEHLFDIAADVERYPEYVPWWKAARIRQLAGSTYKTDQVLAFGSFRQRVSTHTVLNRPRMISVTSTDRPFRQLSLTWSFEPRGTDSCRVRLDVELGFRSRLAERVFKMIVGRSLEEIIDAFEERAARTVAPLPVRSQDDDRNGRP